MVKKHSIEHKDIKMFSTINSVIEVFEKDVNIFADKIAIAKMWETLIRDLISDGVNVSDDERIELEK